MFLITKDYWEAKETKEKGRGIFAKKTILQRTIIGDYVGKIIPFEKVDFDKEKENLYLMYYNDKAGIYPNLNKPGVHLINHSCSPNCWLYKFKNHTLVFALKDIKRGGELTISYLLPPKKFCNPCPHICYCGSKNCTGSMHLTEEKYKIWQGFESKEFKNRRFKEIKYTNGVLEPLKKYPKSIPKSYFDEIKELYNSHYDIGLKSRSL